MNQQVNKIYFSILFFVLCPVLLQAKKFETVQDSINRLYIQAYSYYKANDFENALPLLEKCMTLVKSNRGIYNETYLQLTYLTGVGKMAQKKYKDAIQSLIETGQIHEKVISKTNKDYADIYMYLGMCYMALNQYKESLQMFYKSEQYYDQAKNMENSDYADLQYFILQSKILTGDSVGVRELYYRIESLYKKLYGENCKEVRELHQFGILLNMTQNKFADAERGIQQLQAEGMERLDSLNTIYLYALQKKSSGEYVKALEILEQLLEYCRKEHQTETSFYANLLNLKSNCHSYLGNYPEAVQSGKDVIALLTKLNPSKNNLDLISAMVDTAGDLLNEGTEACALEAADLTGQALVYASVYFGVESVIYARCLVLMARIRFLGNDYAGAVENLEQSLPIIAKTAGERNTLYINVLHSKALYQYYDHQDLSATILKIEELLPYIKETFGESYLGYQDFLRNLTLFHMDASHWEEAAKYASLSVQGLRKVIYSNFQYMSSKERNLFLKKYQNYLQDILPNLCLKMKTDSLLSATLYDAQLLNKGLLLASEVELKQFLLENNEQEAIILIDSIARIKNQLNNAYQITSPQYDESLLKNQRKKMENLEKELVRMSRTYGDFTGPMNKNWKDIRKELGPGEMAIEFIQAPTEDGNNLYAALLLDKNMTSPELITLTDEKNIESIGSERYYTTTTLYSLVWEKILSAHPMVKKIYFSPAGILHNIAIEYLPNSDSTYIHEKISCYRLSSTRELVMNRIENTNKKVSLYGGLQYDLEEKDLLVEQKIYGDTQRGYSLSVDIDSLSLRGSASYLPATKDEVTEIETVLSRLPYDVQLYLGDKGSEASFKHLSGTGNRIIHVASHGFYFSEQETREKQKLLFLNSENNFISKEDKALTRSGLLLSGANYILKGGKLSPGTEDGILTAQEISLLNFKGLDLAVLSACQTGLGEIKGDGVFGLQRGFKKAGANTLLMTLWKVDDKATQLFMSYFYKNLVTGKSKQKALSEAQRDLRDYEIEKEITEDQSRRPLSAHARSQENKKVKIKIKPYKKPRYWAGFILLDAIK